MKKAYVFAICDGDNNDDHDDHGYNDDNNDGKLNKHLW